MSSDEIVGHDELSPCGLSSGSTGTGIVRGLVGFAVAIAVTLTFSEAAMAKVFASQNQALAEAFPEATRIERKTLLLRGDDVEKITAITHQDVTSKIVVIHTAYRDDELLGYAQIDVHNVRTQPEAFLVVLTPEGEVRSVRVLAFHEPLDYLPTESWYAQFAGKTGQDGLRVGRDVHAVAGATLSAHAAADGVRRMLAYWQVLLKPTENSAEVMEQAP
jgi:Na+-translocating ferredoxin:NAD+ oxidoreductase RnfG subunit